ncbi:hypothetical protein K469DRAFT_154659 [Zopfia rhizophila CBS 207.26]|nr:hypothetical protein K469DRAFT_154659 [Zopfia rhizophila CBS 207.26]
MDYIMSKECVQYREEKKIQNIQKGEGCWSKKSRDGNTEAERWERFIGVAETGAESRQKCLPPLLKVGGYWGKEKVQYYGWGLLGEKFCKVLGTAAARVPSWEDASIKLNQLRWRRITTPDRRERKSARLITQKDLEHLKLWTDKNQYVAQEDEFKYQYQPLLNPLPEGYSLD